MCIHWSRVLSHSESSSEPPSGSTDGSPSGATFQEQLKVLRQEQSNQALPGLIATWIALPLVMASPIFLGAPWWSVFFLWPVIGWLQYRIVISGHEAVHKTLCYPEGLNEFFGITGQALVGVNFAAYRLQHMDHHKAAESEQDPDSHIYRGIVETPRGLRRTLVWTAGTLFEILVKIRQKGTGGYGSKRKVSDKVKRDKVLHTGLVLLLQSSILVATGFGLAHMMSVDLIEMVDKGFVGWAHILIGLPAGYLLFWFGPLAVFAVFLNRSRILIEHGLPLALAKEMPEGWGGKRIPTVDIVPGRLEQELFAPFSFNYHCAHHLFMAVPHYNLAKLRALCIEHKVSGYHEIQGSYLQALMRTMRV